MKYIFVTGGVVSSLGKGLAAAALGTLLESRGLKVCLQKFDPYLNLDPGTMSPFQHGEVYVLNDGAETDLDLGHYERFTNCILSRYNNLTSGQVYAQVIENEREGKYLGKTVQVIPHVTDEIKSRIHYLAEHSNSDVLITEIGGTTGDIEGMPFLEAIRQFRLDVGPKNVIIIHVTLIPFIKAAQELKTKPTQQSVAKLREIGISPDVVICRTEKELGDELKQKLSLFCNVPPKAIIELQDVKNTIYEVPLMLQREQLGTVVGELFDLNVPEADLREWRRFVQRIIHPQQRVKIAVVGKYTDLQDAYKSIFESLTHAGADNDCGIDTVIVDSEELGSQNVAHALVGTHGVLVPGGFGNRGIEGKICAARFAREQKRPYLGLCLGMQVATIEIARNVCGLENANSTELDKDTPHPVITLLEKQTKVKHKGASMRLGAMPVKIAPDTLSSKIYGSKTVQERHRHRYEFNLSYREIMEASGFIIAGTSPNGELVEIVEYKNHPWFIAAQFHPEFQSKPNQPHPLFRDFIAASIRYAGA